MKTDDSSNAATGALDAAGITIRLDAFEGPLDLLLHLIRREEIDIWNIPVARITEQYLDYIRIMKDLNVNLVGEWLVMAATLIYIKSRMLLPPDPEETTAPGEEEDPRTELVYQLLEHQKFKNAAQMLYTREEVESNIWNQPPEEALSEGRELVSVSLFDLVKVFHEIVVRFESERAIAFEQEEVTIEQKLAEVRRLLLVRDRILFSSIFKPRSSKQHLIVTFLAILELVRLREIWLYQEKTFEEIYITKGSAAGEAV